ncbi:winged helix-turn-helix domain-containing protein [Streptomyces bambusae]|uniref:winged helix-turn-helix domain-containing protein n=1 Tax=Streptomyces bambusae TaxID=1550616 RepID=UPI001CFD6C56|nr:winged helix-turn-helix domain-containing protein [Streptomyces bambusae]MCB5164494.1 winged helix-turn-helix domain-containing protein [Streptomyces bambusae]
MGVLRLHFTAEDLSRVKINVLGPLAETALGLWNLQRRDAKVLFGGWRARTGRLVTGDGPYVATFLGSPAGGLVDLFTLLGAAGSMAEGLDRLLGAPQGRLREEFAVCSTAGRRRAPWLSGLVAAERRSVERLAAALQDCHEAAVASYWGRIHSHLDGEVALRGRLMVQGGVTALLESLCPMALWKPPVLEVPDYRPLFHPVADFHLAGRPLVLAPSVFCGPVPQLFAGPYADAVVMVYPALHNPVDAAGLWAPPGVARRADAPVPPALSALLGRTRAVVLCVIADHPACTTTQLARRAGISPASASEHATTLRGAGLTALTRERKAALHTLTHLGLALLNTGSQGAPGSG